MNAYVKSETRSIEWHHLNLLEEALCDGADIEALAASALDVISDIEELTGAAADHPNAALCSLARRSQQLLYMAGEKLTAMQEKVKPAVERAFKG